MRRKLGLLLMLCLGIAHGEPGEGNEPEAGQAPEKEAAVAGVEKKGNRKMNNRALDKLIHAIDAEAEGGDGVWQFHFNDVPLICMTDELANRMRIISPILEMDDVTPEQLAKCMEANFDKALDARYCVFRETLWSAFIHPLGDLSPELFESGVSQVVIARLTFGTTYTSGAFQFGGDADEEAEPEPDPIAPPVTA
ncbi:MAG: hypothetical protein AAGJ79_04960 [Verrucomicrobiota bacterium]